MSAGSMRECSYELYVAVYQAVRAGIAQGDDAIVRRMSMYMAERDAETCLVMTLALIEAKRGDPERGKEAVCDGVLCRRCVTTGTAGRAGGASRPGKPL